MVKLTIDGKIIEAEAGSTILEAAKKAGVKIPTLCYLKEINEVGACRICVVEVEGNEKLAASCNTLVEDGMVIRTDSEKVRKARKINLELILSEHDFCCSGCHRNNNCTLQSLAKEYDITESEFGLKLPKNSWNTSDILIKNENRCIKCLRCVDVCRKVQSLSVWEQKGSGSHAKVVAKTNNLSTVCSLCGQCITHCPTGALSARDDTEKVFSAIGDPDKIVVFQIAPAVRTAWAEESGLAPELATEKRMVAAAKALGADYVFDTDFAADLTIMEESAEFIERFTKGEKLPMFTSCCPGWVRFVKLKYPEFTENLSTAKSPQQMFGAVAKSYFAGKIGVSPDKIFCVSVMPCTAKKYECGVQELNSACSKDVDVSLTTREFIRMLKAKNVDISSLLEHEFDSPLGESSGAAVIFGATGGVMEAALRTAYFTLTGENPDADFFSAVRGKTEWREATAEISGKTLRIAVASGLGEAKKLLEAIKSGKAYDFVEIMACPGGCAGGGGQPIKDGEEQALSRGEKLYLLDKNRPIRFSHENREVQKLYEQYLGKPLSEKAESLLHTDQSKWKL